MTTHNITDAPYSQNGQAILLRRASVASVLVACCLLLIKLLAWGATGSVSLLATFVDSLLDALASLINLVAVSIALKPPDKHHPFGHGKAEPLATLVQSAFIAGSVLFLLLSASEHIRTGRTMEESQLALIIMVFSTCLTFCLICYQAWVVRKTGSTAIAADSMHYRVDLLTNLGVIAALLLAPLGYSLADPLIGIAIGIYMLFSVAKVAWHAVELLMDHAMPPEKEQLICRKVLALEQVKGIHNLRTRMSGTCPVIQFDLDLDGHLSLTDAHAIGKQAHYALQEAIPGADITIHLDPA